MPDERLPQEALATSEVYDVAAQNLDTLKADFFTWYTACNLQDQCSDEECTEPPSHISEKEKAEIAAEALQLLKGATVEMAAEELLRRIAEIESYYQHNPLNDARKSSQILGRLLLFKNLIRTAIDTDVRSMFRKVPGYRGMMMDALVTAA